MKKAVLFDLDGVLIDSMPCHYQAWQKLFARYGVQIEPDEVYAREGSRSADMARLLLQDHPLDLTEAEIDKLVRQKSELYNQITRAEVFPGVVELIEELKRRQILLAIVTGTFLENMLKGVPLELYRQFNAVVTGGDVTQGKPQPEPYLKAAQKLALQAGECVVIENAELGVQSARAAGMYCVAVTTTQSREQLQQADRIVPDLFTVIDQINEILTS